MTSVTTVALRQTLLRLYQWATTSRKDSRQLRRNLGFEIRAAEKRAALRAARSVSQLVDYSAAPMLLRMLLIVPLRKTRASDGGDGDEGEDEGVLGKALALLDG